MNRLTALLLGLAVWSCAARGRVATPDEIVRLQQTPGLSASGRISLSGPKGRFSAPIVFGMARPDFLRIEIPSGAGLRFLLIVKHGRLRADLPQDDAMFEGLASGEVMNSLFGIDIEPKDLIDAILGSPPPSMKVGWRFERSLPTLVTILGPNETKLTLTLDEPAIESPPERAFDFAPPRAHAWTLQQMSERLGLRR